MRYNHTSMSNYPLHIYKASAGSGKTFTLAVSYIQMVIQNPEEYRHILAVTFTNKATAEMKQRILSKLYGIAHDTADAKPYFDEIKNRTGLNDNVIRNRANKALQLLIHDYSHFRVETIDSFFQSILRGLARELDLGTGMTIELNTRKVISEAIDTLLKGLKPNDATLIWIFDYISEEVDKGNPWNITDELKDFAANIHSEEYQQSAPLLKSQLQESTLIRELRSYLYQQRTAASQRILACATEFFYIIERHGLSVDDFFYKQGGPCGYYLKIKKGEFTNKLEGRALKASQDPDGWVSDKSPKRDVIRALAQQTLISHINATHQICQECIGVINSCDILRQHLNQLQLINTIHERILSLNKEANRFILADTCQMLRQMQGGDSSFVFEKLGYYIHHVMIDEFQDTSRMQWENFYPLLLEGISTGYNSMLVGDVKQAIYRWRGSDWRILNEEVNRTLAPYTAKEPFKLDMNRRSCKDIIQFNNTLFTQCNTLLAGMLDDPYAASLLRAYSDVEQTWPEQSTGGYVRVTDVAPIDDENTSEAMCREVVAIIDELRLKGIPDKKIAIIVRYNKFITNMVAYMANHRPDICIYSAEAYLLEASTAVDMIITALRWIADPHHRSALVHLAINYHHVILRDTLSVTQILELQPEPFGLPPTITHDRDLLQQTPLYELTEQLYRQLGLEALTSETGYVMAFFDRLLNWCSDSAGDILSFLEYWDNELHATAIPAGASEGIQAMTIHKSKGLEFHTVILPYCNWELNSHRGILWIHSDNPLAQNLATIPIAYNMKMQDSIFADEYQSERFKQIVDNYNLLYVACTRPRNNLFILKEGEKEESTTSKKSGKKATAEITTVSNLISRALQMNGTDHVEYGHLESLVPETIPTGTPAVSDNPFETTFMPIDVSMRSKPVAMVFRQSNLSRQFIAESGDTPSDRQDYLSQGLLLHDILSTMSTADDANIAIDRAVRNGLISTGKERDTIARIIEHTLTAPQAKDWFSGRYELFNECSIIFPDDGETKILRPDRIMSDGQRMIVVDFKFAKPVPNHADQVMRYMQLLNEMGYTHIEGYVWYGYTNHIVPVHLA